MKKSSIIRNEKGVALITALVVAVIGMLITASLLIMVDTGTWFSGSQIRYLKALSAAHGGMQFFAREVLQRCLQSKNLSSLSSYDALNLTAQISDAKFKGKLETTGTVDDGYPDAAVAIATTDTVDTTITLSFSNTPNMAITSGILSTARGNSSQSSNNLVSGGVVNNQSNTITPQQIPYTYQIATEAKGSVNSGESATLDSLYIY